MNENTNECKIGGDFIRSHVKKKNNLMMRHNNNVLPLLATKQERKITKRFSMDMS